MLLTFHWSIFGIVVMDEQEMKNLLKFVIPVVFNKSVAVMVKLLQP